MRIKIKGKVIPTSFLKIEGRGVFWDKIPEKEGRFVELVSNQNPGPEAPPRNKREQEGREQRRCQERSDCQRSDGEH